jgi:hypothetical protein
MIFSRSVHPIMQQWRTTVLQCGEIDLLVIGSPILPASKENTNPFERKGPDGGLMGLPLRALLLVVQPCPERMAYGCGGPFDERLAQEGGTLPAPMDPRFVPAAFRYWRDTRVLLEFLRGGGVFTLFPEGDEEAGGKDGASAWQSGQ